MLSLAVRVASGGVALALLTHFPPFRWWNARIQTIDLELSALRAAVEQVGAPYRAREKGQQFKAAYQLQGRAVASLEEALGIGMRREGREVFVTAFMRAGVAVRVTAALGSATSCGPADRPTTWAATARRLGCDEIRQYHNHPGISRHNGPSRADRITCYQLATVLGEAAPLLRHLIVYWNEVHEWKVLEYDVRA
jgi:hypothetical protein